MTTYQLSPIGGEIFAGRDARRALVPTDAFQKLTKLEVELGKPGFAEMQLDRHASALWLSGKMQRPAEEVLANLDAYSRAYWGKDVTYGQAYDRIVEHERQVMQMAAPAPLAGGKGVVKGEQAPPDENAGKSWQFLRAATGGFARAGHDTVGGTLAMVEGAMNTLGGMPDRPSFGNDPQYGKAMMALVAMEYDGTLDTPEGVMVKAQVEAGRARLEEDFQARMAEYRSTVRGSLAGDVRAGADFFYELGEESSKFYGVSEEYRESTIGKVAEMGGSMVASSALLAAGSLGMLGRLGKAAGLSKRAVAAIQTGELYAANVAGAGQIYAGVEQDRMGVEGEAYRNTGMTFVVGLANAGVQQYIERVPFLDNTLERALKRVPHKGGTVALGDVLREMAKESLSSGIKEGAEEVLQGAWDDFIVEMSYDDTRIDLSDGKADFLKRRAGEALAGFGGGVMLGGVFGGAALYDRNTEARRSERAFSARAGEMLTPEDFEHLRRARTDEQIKAMPNGELLLEGANGNKTKQHEYNMTVFEANFVRTDGMVSRVGDEIGEYKGMPAVKFADGRRVPIDMKDAKQVAEFNAFRRQVASLVQGDAAAAELKARFGESLDVERPRQLETLKSRVDAGKMTPEEARDALAGAGLNPDLALELIAPPRGESQLRVDERTGMARMLARMARGESPDVAIEEVGESWKKKAIYEGNLDPMELRVLREDWHRQYGEEDQAAAGKVTADRADTEWFSGRLKEYAIAGKHTELTGKWWQWIRKLGDKARELISGAQRMRSAMEAGTLDPRLEGWFKAALGTGEQSMKQAEAALRAKEAEGAAQLPALAEMDPVTVQEAMASETFPKIAGNVDDGFTVSAPDGSRIGEAQELEAAQEKAMEWWMVREVAAERDQAKQDAGHVKGNELMDVIRANGGLRAVLVEEAQGNFAGELRAIAEGMSTAERLRTFRKNGMELDRLREALVEEGFDYQTPADVLDAIDRSLRGEPQYATYTNADSVMPGAGTFSLENKQRGPDLRAELIEQRARLATYLEQLGVPYELSESDKSASVYLTAYSRDSAGEITPYKFRFSDHELPGYYEQANFEAYSAERAIRRFAEVAGINLPPAIASEVEAFEAAQARKQGEYDASQARASAEYDRQAAVARQAWQNMTAAEREEWIALTSKAGPSGRIARKEFRRGVEARLGMPAGALGNTDFGVNQTTLALGLKAKGVMPGPGSFSLRATPADASNTLGLPDGSRIVGPTTFSITAYHGSPHKLDKFSLSKIGTGEGAQAYGWGIYLAQSPEVAESYRRSRKPDSKEESAGNLYTVELLPEEAAFMDWDAPFSGQPDAVKAKLELALERAGWGAFLKAVKAYDAGNKRAMKEAGWGGLDYVGAAGSLYDTVAAEVGPEKLSRMLAQAGIPGIRYLDGGSRDVGEGTRNFVLFDEKLVKIVAENGRPVEGSTFSLTDTPAFKEWFGNSKVVDGQGKPLVVYHGTRGATKEAGFAFDFARIGQQGRAEGAGFYFTTNREVASGYAEGGMVMQVFLSIQKPMAYDMKGFNKGILSKMVRRLAQIEAERNETEIADGFLSNYGDIRYEGEAAVVRSAVEALGKDSTALDQISGLVGAGVSAEFVNAAVRDVTGYDGVVANGFGNRGGEENTIWVAFFPEQVKSAIGNRGTFDPTNPDITFSLAQNEFPDMDGGERKPGESQEELPLEYHAARRKIEDTWEKWMQSQGYAELVRMRNEGYVQSIVTARAKHDSAAANIIESVISPTSEAIRRAGALEISRALIRSTAEATQRKERDRRVVTEYAKAIQGLDEGTAQAMDYANANGARSEQNSIADRYGFRPALEGMRAMLTRIRREAIAAGTPIGTFWDKPETVPDGTAQAIKEAGRDAAKIEAILEAAGYKLRIAEYWPRSVIDYDAYIAALTGTDEGMSEMGRAYETLLANAAKAGRVPTDMELQAVAEKVARGLRRPAVQGRKPGALKQRKIDVVPMEHLRFYLKSVDAAYRHVEQMHDAIQLMEFFGDKVRFHRDETGEREPQVNVTDTVKAWLDAGEGGKLNRKQAMAVQKALEARFGYKGSPELIRHIRTFGHLTGLTQIYSPITAQVPDFWNLPIEANFNFADVVGAIYQAATGEKAAGLDKFGLNAREIVREFQTRVPSKYLMKLADALRLQGKPREVVERISLTAALDHLFTWTGFNKLADVANNARVLVQVKTLRRAAERGRLTRVQEDRINRLMTPTERTQLLADLGAGKTAADSPMLALYMWGGISDYVPVSLDQMPPQYLKHPVGRIAYTFKSFMVMQTAAIRRIGVDNIVDGIKEGDRDKVIYGIGMLAAIIAIMQLLGVPGDMLRAYLQNRPYVLKDEFYWRLWGLVGVSHFTALKAKEEGVVSAAVSYVTPPLSSFYDMQRDAADIWDGVPEMGTDMDLSQLRVWNSLPLVGRTYQGWYGASSEKRIEELESGGWFRIGTDPAIEERKAEARRRWLLERYGEE